MEIRAARAEELETLVELQRLVFRPGQAAQPRYWSYVRQEPTYRLDQSRVAVEGERIVAHLRVWDRLLRVRGAQLRAGGIGSVLTHPDFRGRGYARALLQDAERYMGEAGYDLGLLFTIIGTPFYARLGWTAIPLPTFEFELSAAASAGEGMARPLHPENDLEAVSAIYDLYCGNMTGPEVRSPAYWTSGPSRYRGVFPPWGIEQDGRLVAYLNFALEEEDLWIKEACCLPGSEAAFAELAPVALGQAQAAGRGKIAGSLPEGHPLVGHLARLLGASPRPGAHDEMMVKLIDWASLTGRLGGVDLPPPGAAEPTFWRALFGQKTDGLDARLAAWVETLPACQGPFYWWSDIF